ncbi:MAG: hypothetical protein H8D24_01340 [Gammaproteobacteria bacterium]|uniref:Uncharacterized protein n=1 Tax=Candidatus Thiopontia autotrophica TaxID=2841688 RepID=A0A8J6NWU4_9GAMM|nr:hypothetical protein [Candidatus Thiopontia autotrophica]
MRAAGYDIEGFVDFWNVLNQFGLKARVLPTKEEVEISDQFGHKVNKKFSDVLLGKEGCVICIRRIAEKFEKQTFPSMRGVSDPKDGYLSS